MHNHKVHIVSPKTQKPSKSCTVESGRTVIAKSKSLTAKFPIKQLDMERRFGNLYKAINTSMFPNIVHKVITDNNKATITRGGKEEKFKEQTGPVKVHNVLFESQMFINDSLT